MPDIVLHAVFGREVRSALPAEIGRSLDEAPYTFALFGPDIWFLYQPWKRREGRGRRMHTTRPGDFLMALADRCRESRHPQALFSYLAGFLCHYALDTATHPYIVYKTEQEYHYPRCHMAFEHSLDVQELRRAGHWGDRHPVTRHYFPPIRLPETIREDLDAVFQEIYGWRGCWKALNASYPRHRLCYRILENPKGLFSLLARITGSPRLKSFSYSESHFNDMDVENRARREWLHSHDSSLRFNTDFSTLRAEALRNAVALIEAAWHYVFEAPSSRDSLKALIGNKSYLSGLPADDPRNLAVPSLLPPEKAGRGDAGKERSDA